jgi:hypothetical protein
VQHSSSSSSSSASEHSGAKGGRERRLRINGDGAWREGAAIKTGNNAVTTSKYTVLTFIPKNIIEQFKRAFRPFPLPSVSHVSRSYARSLAGLANIYFLMISAFQVRSAHMRARALYLSLPLRVPQREDARSFLSVICGEGR